MSARTSSARKRAPRPIRTTSSSPRSASRFTVRTDTPRNSATSRLRSRGSIRGSAYAVAMRPIEPQRDPWAESSGENEPPVWQHVRGISRGGFVYQHRNGAVVYLRDDGEGYLEVATWEPTDELALPDRGALEEIVSADVEQMAATPSGRAMLMVSGVSELAAMRPSVGRPRLWSDDELLTLAREFLEHGDHWTSDHARWAQKRGLERRHVRKLMRRAELAGLITIDKSRGARSANVHALTGVEPKRIDARASADWHRRSSLELERKRSELEHAWHVQQASATGSGT